MTNPSPPAFNRGMILSASERLRRDFFRRLNNSKLNGKAKRRIKSLYHARKISRIEDVRKFLPNIPERCYPK